VAEPRRNLLDFPFVAAPLSALLWAADVLIVIAWTPAVALVRLFTHRSDPKRERPSRLLRKAAAFAGWINPYWDFQVIDESGLDPERPHLFVANHKSLADVFLLARLPWEMKYLSKDSILKIPLLGWQMRTAGDIAIERGDKESARRAIDGMRDRFLRGSSVIVFPEGTRSAEGTLGPFRDGAFRLAIEVGVDVVPMAIRGTETALPKHSLRFGRTRASVTVLAPVPTAGLTPADAPALAESVRGRIAAALGVE
jgi:1-acyl-sn-glycerol-3-phosphate acyltransferase